MPSPKRKAKPRISQARRQRWEVLKLMLAQPIEGYIPAHELIQNVDVVCQWLKDGIVRTKDGAPVLRRVAGTDQ